MPKNPRFASCRRRRARARLDHAFFALLFIGACRSESDQGGPLDQGVGEALTAASPTLAQAVAGKIQPVVGAPGNLISAAIIGEPNVGADGSASYGFPIWVPAGINGLQPSLSVEYNSSAPAGLLGPRWRISGLSSITRCTKTLAQDGVQSVMDFLTTGDTFCVDGQRLIRLNSTSSEFFTERESYTHIIGSKDNTGRFSSFVAYQRDGRIFHYGTTLSSRLHGRPLGTSAPDSTYAYYLDKIEDRYGNAIAITYLNGNPSSDTGAVAVQELEPLTITWGATQQRSVTFNYNPLPAGAAINPQMHWVHGLGIGHGATLSNLVIKGPDGTLGGPAVVLKQYNFSYTNTPVTDTGAWVPGSGNSVLTSFSECDAAGVCKKPTTLTWSGGSNAYQGTDYGITDAAFGNASYSRTVGRTAVNFASYYQRIMAVDLNNDGLDDIVYRNFATPHHSGFNDCVGWLARLSSVNTSGITTFGPPTALRAIGGDPDPSCRSSLISSTAYQTVSAGTAFPGDLLFTDLDGDGDVDILSPIGQAGVSNNPLTSAQMVGYRGYLNGGTGPGTFGNPIDFIDSSGQPPSLGNFTSLKAALVGIGDLDGDGLTDIVRPTENPPIHLQAATLSSAALVGLTESRGGTQFPYWVCNSPAACNKAIPDVSQTLTSVSLVDLDGDGTAEVLRDFAPCQNLSVCQPGATSVTSPTMNTQILLASAGVSSSTSTFSTRWFLDLNGDGRLDVAWISATSGVSNSYTIWTEINNGTAFASPLAAYTISLSNPALLQPLVVDFNLDGRQDLIVNSPNTFVLLSDGKGGFTTENTSVPVAAYNSSTQRADRLITDLNGDGLPDILQLEGTAPNTKLIGYTRSGKAPEMVLAVLEGTGRQVSFTYDVASPKDPTFYTVNSAQSCAADPQHLTCLNHGLWLTRSLSVVGTDVGNPATQTYSYSGGVIDKFGRGFLGFSQRDIYGPGSRHVSITYSPTTRLTSGNHYTYPYALMPQVATVDTNTSQGTNPHHYDYTSWFYNVAWTTNGTFTVVPFDINNYQYDCPTTDGKTCSSSATSRLLGYRIEGFSNDAYGNLTSHTSYSYDQNGASLGVNSETHHFLPANTSAWLVSLPDPSRPDTFTSSVPATGESATRTVKYTPDTTHGGLVSIETEPTGLATDHKVRTFNRDASTGKLVSVTDTAPGTGQSRTTSLAYEDPDNVYVSATTDPVGHTSKVWRHPGLGLVVEMDDPNGLASTASYDTFGRPLSATAGNGASTVTSYQDAAGRGAALTVSPEGKSTRAITVHYDSFGREASRTSPIDGVQTLTETRQYDALSRLSQKVVRSGSTVLNTYTYGYDDLDRPLSSCHLSTDNANHCASNSYDGLTATVTDESGQVTTKIADSLGRPSIQRATLQTGMTDTTFGYGPFDVLEEESVSDATGGTTFGYDVLGRRISSNRFKSGERTIVYNAFGDVVQTGKIGDVEQPADTVVMGRDGIGRVTSMTTTNPRSVPVTRTFYWDAPYQTPTIPAPNAIGKLVDVFDGQNQVHFDYDPNGQVHAETWSLSLFGQPVAPQGQATLSYDSQGRVQSMTYPSMANSGNTPLQLLYTYDPYTGTTASVADGTAPTLPLWRSTARNAYGEVTGETLRPESFNYLTKVNSYYPQNGLLASSGLNGSNGQLVESYTYQANSLPATFGASGIGGTWASTFGYDNLGQLDSWQTVSGGPTVFYQYDSDGNMMYRWWTVGDLVTYARSSLALTKTTLPFGGTAQTDTYQVDQWGRTYDTPAVTLTYDASDEITTVVEKANGNQTDTIIHDGLGNRVATTYGNGSGGDYLLTLMGGLYEYRFTAATGGREERCRLVVDGRTEGDVVTSNTAGRSATFYLTDNLGSAVAEGGSAGTVTARLRRDPYGNLLSNPSHPSLPPDVSGTNPDGTSSFGFTERDRQTNWGLVDMRARLYSPALGQFISPDPVVGNLFDRRDYNPFAYAHNSPTALRDPTGLCPPEDTGCDGDGSGDRSWVPTSGSDIKYFFKHIIGHDVGRVFFGEWIGQDFFGHDVGKVLFGRYIGKDFFGDDVGGGSVKVAKDIWSGLKAAYNYFFGSSPPPVPVPTAQTPSTSPNASGGANAGIQAGGTTESTTREAPAQDAVDIGTSIFGNWAERTPVQLWQPPSFGAFGYQPMNEPVVPPLDLRENLMLENAMEPLQGMGDVKALDFVKGIDEGATTVSVGTSFLDSMTKLSSGDTAGGGLSALEGAAMLSAASLGPVGALGAGSYGLFKINLYLDVKAIKAGATYESDGMGGEYWSWP
jgi:RHS repeat-associated protein